MMLDFYKIPDETPKPDWPEKINLERVDGLEILFSRISLAILVAIAVLLLLK